jgi:hypothetical protein
MMNEHMVDKNTERRATFEAALNTQYFILQTARGNTVAESGSRATLYVMALSSTLVATGFVSQSHAVLGPFLAGSGAGLLSAANGRAAGTGALSDGLRHQQPLAQTGRCLTTPRVGATPLVD